MTRIVTLKDKKPLIVRPEDVKDGPVTICRCGLSAEWPYCDDSHKETRSEADGTLYRYRRDAKCGPRTRRGRDAQGQRGRSTA